MTSVNDILRILRASTFDDSQLTPLISQAKSQFLSGTMSSCARNLCLLQRHSNISIRGKSALHYIFNDVEIANSYKIFALGYELGKTSDGKAVMNRYMHNNVVKIVQLLHEDVQVQSNYGKAAYLCPYNKVGSGSWQWAYLRSSGYENRAVLLDLVPSTRSKYEIMIKADYGCSSYLCTTKVGSGSYQYAFFGTASYNKSYDGGQHFRLYHISGDEFKVEATYGETSYLCVTEVTCSGQYAFFGTPAYIDSKGYSAGETLKIIFD